MRILLGAPNLQIERDLVVLRDEGIIDPRILVPESLIDHLIEATHEGPMSAHEGAKKVLLKLAHCYY